MAFTTGNDGSQRPFPTKPMDNYEQEDKFRRDAVLQKPTLMDVIHPLSIQSGELAAVTILDATKQVVEAARKAAKAYEDDAVAMAKEVEELSVQLLQNASELANDIAARHANLRDAGKHLLDTFKQFPIIALNGTRGGGSG